MATETDEIITKLDAIKAELDYIKEHLVDADAIMTEDDTVAREKAREEFRAGKTIPLEKLRKELGM